MSMWEAVGSVFRNYANFSGRARRSEYWKFFLFNFLVALIIGVVETVALDTRGAGSAFYRLWTGLGSIYSLGTLIPGMAVSWRRLHDVGKSGLFYFVPLITTVAFIIVIVVVILLQNTSLYPAMNVIFLIYFLALLVYGILMLIWLAREGTRGDNKYGPDPKAEPEAAAEKAPWEL